MNHLIDKSLGAVADGSAGVAVFAAGTADQATALASACVAVGAIVLPRALDWYKEARKAKREEDALDLKALSVSVKEDIAALKQSIGILQSQVAALHCQNCPSKEGPP